MILNFPENENNIEITIFICRLKLPNDPITNIRYAKTIEPIDSEK